MRVTGSAHLVCLLAMPSLWAGAALADQLISSNEIISAVPEIISSDCQVSCSTDTLSFREVQFSEELEIGSRRSFLVWDPSLCGSAGCPTAAIVIGEDGVFYLGDGLGLNEHSASILPISTQRLIAEYPYPVALSPSGGPPNESLAERYPSVQKEIASIFSGSPLAREAITETFENVIELAYSETFGQLVLNRLSVAPNEFLDKLFLGGDLFGSGVSPSFTQNVSEGFVKDAAISITSDLVSETIVREWALPGADRSYQNLAVAALSTAIQEPLHFLSAPDQASAVGSGLIRRFWDLVDIYLATQGLIENQDQQMIAAVVGTDSVAELMSREPSEQSDRIAKDVFEDILGRAENIYGPDDAVAVAQILKLERSALIRQKQGDTETAIMLRDRIVEVGNDASNVSPFALIVKPKDWVDAAFNWGKDGPQRAARIAIEGTSLRELPSGSGQQILPVSSTKTPSGALCELAENPLSGGPLKSLLWGAKISGTNEKDEHWDEYLARGGDIANTIFVNATGKETIGVYKITESQVCFSYGAVARWNCKTVSTCKSGEAPWVITDLKGKQTSLIHAVEPYGFAPYHTRRWADLASQQQLAIPLDGSKPRQYTPIPPNMETTVVDLERLFSGPGLTSTVEKNSCRFTIVYKSPIAGNRDFSSGGWEWWLGSNSSGQNTVGVETLIYTVDLESYDVNSSLQSSARGNTTLNPLFGRSFSLRTITQRTDDDTLSSDESQAIGGFFFKGLNSLRISQLLQELSDVCAGRSTKSTQQTSASQVPPLKDHSFEAHHCTSVDNDIARLQCFDAAFGNK